MMSTQAGTLADSNPDGVWRTSRRAEPQFCEYCGRASIGRGDRYYDTRTRSDRVWATDKLCERHANMTYEDAAAERRADRRVCVLKGGTNHSIVDAAQLPEKVQAVTTSCGLLIEAQQSPPGSNVTHLLMVGTRRPSCPDCLDAEGIAR